MLGGRDVDSCMVTSLVPYLDIGLVFACMDAFWSSENLLFCPRTLFSLDKTFVVFGGCITVFQLFHTPCKVRKLSSHQRNSKKGSFVHTPPSLDSPKSHCYIDLTCDAHGARDLLDQLSLLGWRLTTRLDLKPVVLTRHCRRHIYTLLPTIESGFRLSHRSPTVRTLGSPKNVN
jgi:hypothetical protein